MTDTPETTYRGHVIRWSDNSDEWTCYDLSDRVRSSPKLSVIKTAIDRMYLAERKDNAVECHVLGRSGTRIDGTVVEYLKPRIQWQGRSQEYIEHRVAVVYQSAGSTKRARSEKKLDELAPLTAEADTAYQEYLTLKKIADDAVATAKKAFDQIPRLTPDDLTALVELYERGDEPD